MTIYQKSIDNCARYLLTQHKYEPFGKQFSLAYHMWVVLAIAFECDPKQVGADLEAAKMRLKPKRRRRR